MLKILTSQQMSCVDQITIANEPIGSLDLMERPDLFIGLIPQVGLDAFQSSVPEAMVLLRSEDELNDRLRDLKINSIAIGPGMGTVSDALMLFEWILQHYNLPMVIDADALNILSLNHKLMALLPKNCNLTPHVKEFERLFGSTKDEFVRIKLLSEKAESLGQYIVLKGPHTAIATPDGQVFFNYTGNPGMETAVSGDCLTGIIAGLLAQTQDSFAAAVYGVFLHGKSGDIARDKKGQHALIASDIIEHVGDAIKVSINFDA